MEKSGPHKHSILRNKEVPKNNAPHKPRDVTRPTVMVKRYGFHGILSIKYKIDFWNNPITASVLVWNQVVLNQSQQLGYLNPKLMLSWDCPFNGMLNKSVVGAPFVILRCNWRCNWQTAHTTFREKRGTFSGIRAKAFESAERDNASVGKDGPPFGDELGTGGPSYPNRKFWKYYGNDANSSAALRSITCCYSLVTACYLLQPNANKYITMFSKCLNFTILKPYT